MKNKITIDKALIFSVSVLFVYSIITEIQIFMDKIPNDTLTVSIFAVFGLAEGGFCTYLHTKKKERQNDSQDNNNSNCSDHDDYGRSSHNSDD